MMKNRFWVVAFLWCLTTGAGAESLNEADQLDVINQLHRANLAWIEAAAAAGEPMPDTLIQLHSEIKAATDQDEFAEVGRRAVAALNVRTQEALGQAESRVYLNPELAGQGYEEAKTYAEAAEFIATRIGEGPGSVPLAEAQRNLAQIKGRTETAAQRQADALKTKLGGGATWFEREAMQWEVTYATPSVRYFFDIGSDTGDNDLRVFSEGGVSPVVNIAELYLPMEFGRIGKRKQGTPPGGGKWFDDWKILPGTFPTRTVEGEERPAWYWGPTFGVGLTGPAEDSEDGTMEANGAPVLLATAGWASQFMIEENVTLIVEAGIAYGFSAQRDLTDSDDTAFYVGVGILIPFQ